MDTLARIVSLSRNACETRISEIISSPLLSVSKGTDTLAVMQKMREDGIRRHSATRTR